MDHEAGQNNLEDASHTNKMHKELSLFFVMKNIYSDKNKIG